MNLGARVAVARMMAADGMTFLENTPGAVDGRSDVWVCLREAIQGFLVSGNVFLQQTASTVSVFDDVDAPFEMQQEPEFERGVRDGRLEFQLPRSIDGVTRGRQALVILWAFRVEDHPHFVEIVFEPGLGLGPTVVPRRDRRVDDAGRGRAFVRRDHDHSMRFQFGFEALKVEPRRLTVFKCDQDRAPLRS